MTVIAKMEILFVGLTFGVAGWLAGLTFIKRRSKGTAAAMNKAIEELKVKKIKLWIFPEGTRRNTGEIHSFKKGAFHAAIYAQVPIVPIVFSSYKNILDVENKVLKGGELTISVLPEISTEKLLNDDVTDLMERTRNLMIEKYRATSNL